MTSYNNIPLELRLEKRWCFTGRERDDHLAKAPHMLAPDANGNVIMRPISTVDEYHYCLTYFDLEPLIDQYPDRGIGYILVDGDGFTCIDLDVKDDSPISLSLRHADLIDQLNSYTEVSNSGCGTHIWFKGEIDGVIKTSDIEVYSRERFIICTGNVIRDVAIAFDQSVIDFFNDHTGLTVDYEVATECEEKEPDEVVISKARDGDNTGKFDALFSGDWQAYVDIISGQRDSNMEFNPSDADASLMTILTFYSQNYEQCKRLWQASALADVAKRYSGNKKEMKRKARNTGTEYKLKRAFNYGMYLNNLDQQKRKQSQKEGQAIGKAVAKKFQEDAAKAKAVTEDNCSDRMDERGADGHLPPITLASDVYPPGALGDLAKYFYSCSIKQIPEFAIAEALAVAAGMFGRAYNISGTGLNIFMMILAPSGTGKSALSKNPQSFMLKLERERHANKASEFISTTRFTHENAMFHEFKTKTSFCQTISEFGKTFRNMTGDNAGALATVREQMTDVFSKSGHNDVVGGLRYSTMEKSVAIPHSVAYSFLGESVAGPFYEAVDYEMLSDGFISRFTVTEYTGEIPYDNVNADIAEPSPKLLDKWSECAIGVARALMDPEHVTVVPVRRDPESSRWFTKFSTYCTDQANTDTDNALWTSLWTRTNLKVMKIAALLAVSENYMKPEITMPMVDWAYNFIMRHNHTIINAAAEHGLEGGVSSRITTIENVMRDFMNTPPAQLGAYRVKGAELMQADGVVPWSYMQQRCARLSIFAKGNRSVTDNIRDSVREMIDMGRIRKVTSNESKELYDTRSVCYQYSR